MSRHSLDDDGLIAVRAFGCLRTTLPAGWDVTAVPTRTRADSWIVRAPDGSEAVLAVAVMHAPSAREIHALPPLAAPEAPAVLVARVLRPAARAALEAAGRCYVDTTGNISLCLTSPGLVVKARGADRDVGPVDLPGLTLDGPVAARLVRVLCDARLPLTAADARRRAGIAAGAAPKIFQWLTDQGLIVRARGGPVTSVDVRALLDQWADAYAVLHTHRTAAYRDPPSVRSLAERLAEAPGRVAITGTFAADRLVVHAPRRPMLIYAEQPEVFAARIGLVATDTDPDVIVLDPADGYVFDRTWRTGGLVFASPSQVAIDLLTGPAEGRPFAGDVIGWMVRRRA